MRKTGFWLAYLLLLIAQIVLGNFLGMAPLLMMSVLPVMVLCIPIRIGDIPAMLIAFATGLLTDLLSEGVIGLNALALVPVAALRNRIISLVFGHELLARKEDFSIRKSGLGQIAMAVFLSQAVFLLIYVWADSAGTRPFWFNAARFGLSVLSGFVLSMIVVGALAPDSRR